MSTSSAGRTLVDKLIVAVSVNAGKGPAFSSRSGARC
jgi:hypothetical protein